MWIWLWVLQTLITTITNTNDYTFQTTTYNTDNLDETTADYSTTYNTTNSHVQG